MLRDLGVATDAIDDLAAMAIENPTASATRWK